MNMRDYPFPSNTPLQTTERREDRITRAALDNTHDPESTGGWRPQGADEADRTVETAKLEKKRKGKKTAALQSKTLPNFDYMFFFIPSLRVLILSLFPVAVLMVALYSFFADQLNLPIWAGILVLALPLLGDTAILSRIPFVWRQVARNGELREKKYRKEFPLVPYTLLYLIPLFTVDVWYWPLALAPFAAFTLISIWGRVLAPRPPFNVRPEDPVEI